MTVEPQARRSLAQWVERINAMHPQNIALGLDRISKVKERLAVSFNCPVVVVGGTNGKGSTCMMLETLWRAAGYRVGQYTSPHIHRFNERIRIDGQMVDDGALVVAFEAVETVRDNVPLTFFEFTTLVAMKLFADAGLDVVVFEVGLGGRFDAVNLLDADVAIVTNVAIDHVAFLGDTCEKIGFEKAGIYRKDKVALYGEKNPPQSLLDYATAIGADLKLYGRDYIGMRDGKVWHYYGPDGTVLWELPHPSLYGNCQVTNAATALTTIYVLRRQLPVVIETLFEALQQIRLPGRFDIIQQDPLVIVDVAHNPHAAKMLADNLQTLPCQGRTLAVYGAMADKDIDGIIHVLKDKIDAWYVTNLPLTRAAKAGILLEKLLAAGVPKERVTTYDEAEKALDNARKNASNNDRIIAFGSFWVVTGVTVA